MAVDLTSLPVPTIVETLRYEDILAEIRTFFVGLFPTDEVDASTRSVPTQDRVDVLLDQDDNVIAKILQAYAYHAMVLRARINAVGTATMVAYAAGADLDNLAALYGVTRKVGESDNDLRNRILLAVDGFSTAGPTNAYIYHALSADDAVKDAGVESPTPGQVVVSVLSTAADGVPDQALLDIVFAAVNDDDIRPLTDEVIVQAATVTGYVIDAQIWCYSNVDSEIVRQSAIDAAQNYADATHKLGYDITISGLHRALHQSGVQRVELISPTATIVNGPSETSFCTSITVSYEGVDV